MVRRVKTAIQPCTNNTTNVFFFSGHVRATISYKDYEQNVLNINISIYQPKQEFCLNQYVQLEVHKYTLDIVIFCSTRVDSVQPNFPVLFAPHRRDQTEIYLNLFKHKCRMAIHIFKKKFNKALERWYLADPVQPGLFYKQF